MTGTVHFPHTLQTPLDVLAALLADTKPHLVLHVPWGALMPGCDSVCAKCLDAEVYAGRVKIPGAFEHTNQSYDLLLVRIDVLRVLEFLHHGKIGKFNFPGYVDYTIKIGPGFGSEYRPCSPPGKL